MHSKLFIILLLSSILSIYSTQAYVISNSEDWRDVYSSVHYANLKGDSSDFLVSSLHGTILLSGVSKDSSLELISSRSKPYVFGFSDLAQSEGFNQVTEREVRNANLELIDDLPEINSFIIVGNTYGYNAIAVAPYAVVSKSWVFFADAANIDEIDAIIAEKNNPKVIIYGYVDRSVKETLRKYNIEEISKGDRFEDNIEIVKKYLELKPNTKQAVLSNGEFIEKEIMSGLEPVLFTGKENVPDQIGEYLKNSDLEVGVLVGSDLIGAATNIRRTTGINVIVKFARGARVPGAAISPVEGLDLFYLPIPIMNLTIASLRYNRANNQLQITYKSNANVPLYFRGTITFEQTNGDTSRTGDASPVFIAPGEFKTVNYSDVRLPDTPTEAEVSTLYGESPKALEKLLRATLKIDLVNIIDNCKLDGESTKLTYSPSHKTLYLYVKNPSDLDCWANAELLDVKIDGRETTLSSEKAILIPAGKKRALNIKQELTESDIIDNEYIEGDIYFGEKQDSLVNRIHGKFKLDIERFSTTTIILAILIVLVILLIFFLLWRRKKKEEDW